MPFLCGSLVSIARSNFGGGPGEEIRGLGFYFLLPYDPSDTLAELNLSLYVDLGVFSTELFNLTELFPSYLSSTFFAFLSISEGETLSASAL